MIIKVARGRPDYSQWSAPIRPETAQSQDIYQETFTVPKNTSDASPATTKITMESGVVSQVEIIIPPGHAALAGLRIKNEDVQVIPKSGWLKGDNQRFVVNCDISLTGDGSTPPVYSLTLEGYNNDDTYDHSFYVTVTLLVGV